MKTELRKTGISVMGDIPWGTHFCHFYETKEDLLDILIPYFKTGLENNELCLWVVSDPLSEEEARNALKEALPETGRYLAAGHIEIVPYTDWYLKRGSFVAERVIDRWNEKLTKALAEGYAGIRVNATEGWLTTEYWHEFLQYEKTFDQVIANRRMIVLCSYSLSGASAVGVMDVVHAHQCAIVRRKGNWEVVETTEIKRLKKELERMVIERTQELAAANEQLRREISERKRTEETLRQSEFELAEAQRVAGLGSWSLDINANAVRWSEQLYRIFDVEKTDFGVTYETFLSRVHPDDRPRVWQVNAETRSSGQPFQVEYRIATRGGRLVHIREIGYARMDRAGAVSGLFGTAQDITERKRAEEALQISFDQLRALAARLQSVREEERTRVAREIHDQLGQALTAIKIDLSSLVAELPDAQKYRPGKMESILKLVDETIQSIRRISTQLRPGILDDLGLVAAVEWAAEEFEARTGIKCWLDLPEDSVAIDPECATAIFRIFQETLTNVARHANATVLNVRLAEENDNLILEVHDNGSGISEEQVAARQSLGILGMRERALLLGGELTISGAPGRGTTMRVRIPSRAMSRGSARD